MAAAFECKLTFRQSHLPKLFKTAAALSRITEKEHSDRKLPLKLSGQNYAYQEYHRIFEYGLLAHSFEGKKSKEFVVKISDKIFELDLEYIRHPNEMVDLICIQDLGSWVSEKSSQKVLSDHILSSLEGARVEMVYGWVLGAEGWLS